MHRRWRVRHSYPQPVVELVRLLLPLRAVREISGLLDIPLSVIYRWRALESVGGAFCGRRPADAQAISSVIARCHELGFSFTVRPAPAIRPDRPASAPAQPLPEVSAPGREFPVHASDAGACVDDCTESAAASQRCTAARQPYTFDANKERSTRRVRQRLEAARRMIDAEYFLDIDCRMLADTAQMSRHHFIRMFSQMFGNTPHQRLIRTRVEAAKRLLLASREPIEVVAAGVGFRSGQSLTRAFKQTEGVSVSRFCSAVAKHASMTRTATPLREPGRDRHLGSSDVNAAVASGAHASSPPC